MTKIKNIKRPTNFKHGAYTWKIKWLVETNDKHGLTLLDEKEIHIYLKNSDESTLRDTLLHEILHVCNEDIFDVIKEIEDAFKMEESHVRLTTPRLMRVMTSNKELINYIFHGGE